MEYKADPQKVLEQMATEQLLSKLPRSVQIYSENTSLNLRWRLVRWQMIMYEPRRPMTDQKKLQPRNLSDVSTATGWDTQPRSVGRLEHPDH